MTSPSTSILSSLTRAAFALALSAPVLACGGIEPDAVEPDAVDTESADEAITIGPLQLSRIVYQRSGEIRSMANDGTGDVLHTSGSRPSYSQGRTRMAYATGGAIKVVDAPFDAAAFAAAFTVYSGSGTWAGVDPAISLDGTKVTFATAGLGGYGATLFHYTMGTTAPFSAMSGPVMLTSLLSTGAPAPSAFSTSARDFASKAALLKAACAYCGNRPVEARRPATRALCLRVLRRVCMDLVLCEVVNDEYVKGGW